MVEQIAEQMAALDLWVLSDSSRRDFAAKAVEATDIFFAPGSLVRMNSAHWPNAY